MNRFGAAPSDAGTVLNKGGNDFDGFSSNASSMFIKGGDNQGKFMDESSAGGSVL